jgi:hypothetical protein
VSYRIATRGNRFLVGAGSWLATACRRQELITEHRKTIPENRRNRQVPVVILRQQAGVTQLVECLLPKQDVVGSSPITRSS